MSILNRKCVTIVEDILLINQFLLIHYKLVDLLYREFWDHNKTLIAIYPRFLSFSSAKQVLDLRLTSPKHFVCLPLRRVK